MKKLLLATLVCTATTHAAPAAPSDLPLPVYWLDMDVLRALEARAQEGELWQGRIINIPPVLESAARLGPVVWSERFGVAADKLREFAHHPGEERQGIWGFRDAASAKAAFEHLDREGFAALPGGEKALGTPGELDLIAIDEFWRPVGEPVVFALRGDLLWQGSNLPEPPPDPWHQILWQPTLSAVRTALPEDAQLLQAGIFTIEQGIQQSESDIADILLQPGKKDPEKIMAALAPAEDGLPPYLGGVIADAQHGDKAILQLTLIYPDCDTAEKAKAALPARWQAWKMRGKMVPDSGSLDTRTLKPGQRSNHCYAMLHHVSDNPRVEEHPALRAAWGAFYRGQFGVIAIAIPVENRE
ncbi:MAG: hypothetical protein Q4D61_07205 [Cardiobacteriaceae bacterium]|nr:hypothetical protein [Cardiobacteriaceae bacterium]